MGHGARKVVGGARHLGVDEGPRRQSVALHPGPGRGGRSRQPPRRGGRGDGHRGGRCSRSVAAALGRDRDRALGAIAAAHARDLPNRLGEAVRTARALVASDQSAEIYVYTDGVGPLGDGPDLEDPRIRWIGVGRGGRNVAITNLAVRKNYYGAFDYQAFVSLVNYTPETQEFTFSLDLDDKPVAEKSVTLEPNVRRSVVLPFSHTGGGTVAARLRVDDDLAADNVAYAVLPPPEEDQGRPGQRGQPLPGKGAPHRSPGRARGEGRRSVSGWHGRGRRRGAGLRPCAAGRAGSVHLRQYRPRRCAHRGDGRGWSARPSWTGTATIWSCATSISPKWPSRMRCASGRLPRAALWSRRWASPLIYALEEQDRKAILIGFDLFKTDFPLRVAFPLILSNSLRWLHPSGADQASLQFAAGQPVLLPVPHGVAAATVTTPSGRSVKAQITRGMVSFSETDEVGVYSLSTPKGETKIAVNLMDADESDLAPRPLPPSAAGPAAAVPPVPVQRELWPLFVGRRARTPSRRGATLLAPAERGTLEGPRDDGRPLGPRPPRRARPGAGPDLPPPDPAALGGSPQRGIPARRLGQRQPGRSRARLSIRRRGRQAPASRRPGERDRLR